MKRFLASSAIVGALLLGSCTTVPGVDPITGQPIATEVANIQALAVQICAFQPTAATVTAILGTLIPGASPVTTVINQVASSICAAVTKPAFRAGGAFPEVNGIPIQGHFVAGRRHRR